MLELSYCSSTMTLVALSLAMQLSRTNTKPAPRAYQPTNTTTDSPRDGTENDSICSV